MLPNRAGMQRKIWKRNGSSRDDLMGNHQNEKWWLPSFFVLPSERECISTHKVRAQLDIKDVILRGLGMRLQQAKCARVRTRALLANLRSNNDCGLGVWLNLRNTMSLLKEKVYYRLSGRIWRKIRCGDHKGEDWQGNLLLCGRQRIWICWGETSHRCKLD